MDAKSRRLVYEHQFIEDNPGYRDWGGMVCADFDGDGRMEFATGGRGGFYHLYDLEPAGRRWTRHVITHAIEPQVGAAAVDYDGDGRMEIVCGDWHHQLWWIERPKQGLAGWTPHVVWEGLTDPHDMLAGDVDGDGKVEVLVREKDGRAMIFRPGAEVRDRWVMRLIAEGLSGDGTALTPSVAGRGLDVVTNQGWFVNVNGDGTRWERRPLVPEGLGWDRESRLVVADMDGDGQVEVVITESELKQNARLALLHRPGSVAEAWRPEILLPAEGGYEAIHSLAAADLDGDGRLEIFAAEMEKGRGKWMALSREGAGWRTHVLLDANLGTHSAAAVDVDGDGRLELVGKTWHGCYANGNRGRSHVDCLWPVGRG